MANRLKLKHLPPLFSLCFLSCGCFAHAEFIEHHWNIMADAVFMRRSEIHDKPLVKDQNKLRKCDDDCNNFTVISTEGLVKHFHFDPGFRVGLLYSENVKNSFEAIFLWVQPWDAHLRASDKNSLFFPFNNSSYAFDYFQADEAHAKYDSRFWDIELNYWHHFSPRHVDYFSLSGTVGLRYFHLNEAFKLTFLKPPDKSDYSIHTENDVFGVQMGLNLEMTPTSRISWDFTAKVGATANRAKQRNLLRDLNNTLTLRRYERQKWQRGLFADLIAQAGYQFKEPLNLHAGYEFIVLSGVALAPEQVERDTGGGAGKEVYTDGFVFIHGFYIGATLSF
ncbi:MAG TPA: hypothetical protein VGJ00_05915 [Rhabdochlamydiaceae bacterium]|jgi:hypothetical protein